MLLAVSALRRRCWRATSAYLSFCAQAKRKSKVEEGCLFARADQTGFDGRIMNVRRRFSSLGLDVSGLVSTARVWKREH